MYFGMTCNKFLLKGSLKGIQSKKKDLSVCMNKIVLYLHKLIPTLKGCVLHLSLIDDDISPCILDEKYQWAPVNEKDEVVVRNGDKVIFACPGVNFINVKRTNFSYERHFYI